VKKDFQFFTEGKAENKFSAPCFVTFAAKATAAISPSETSHKSTKKGNFRYAKVMVIKEIK